MVDNAPLDEDRLQPLVRSLQQTRSVITSLLDDGASTLTYRQTASALLEEHLGVLSSLRSELAGRIIPSSVSAWPLG